MDDKLKVFWNLDVLVKMCRSKSDGPSLRIEEDELLEKIDACQLEIEEIKSISDDESYDTSAEMADRNIEIITKKQLQTLKATLKEKNKELNSLKEEEKNIYSSNSLLRDNKLSQEKYIVSMQERINEATDYEVIDRYNSLIAEATEKIASLVDDLEDQDFSYNRIQEDIIKLSDEIAELEDKIDKKKKILAETQANLENKSNYIDKTKKDKNDKKIAELEIKIQKLTKRLEEIRKDPKYLESKIKDVINSKEDIEIARPYFIELINTVIKVPYINVPADNSLEEELLKATQARDTFANEIEQKSYNILEADTPEKIRIEFLNERINLWNKELEELKIKVDVIDRDQEYNYEEKNQALYRMLDTMKKDLREFERAYEEVPEINVGAKASVKAALDEKRTDIIEAEKIVTAFRKDESEDIARATRTIKYECDRLNQSIQNAENEIEAIKNRLTSKKSGLIDISTKNKDKDTLKELAQTVIDIKHRRQFPETPLEIIERLEEELEINLFKDIDKDIIANSSTIVKKDYEEYELLESKKDLRRGIKVIEETEVEPPIEETEKAKDTKVQEAEAELQSLIENIEAKEKTKKEETKTESEDQEDTEPVIEETEEEIVSEETEDDSTEEEIAEPVIEEETSEVEISPEEPQSEESVEETEETTPVVEEIEEPIVEVPMVEEQVVEEEIPTEVPVAEETVVEEPTLVAVEELPAEDAAPVVEVPEVQEVEQPVEEITVVQDTPVEETTETIEEVIEPTVVEETIPEVVEEIAPIVEVPMVEETVIEEEVPTEVPVTEETVVEEPTLVAVEELPVEDVAPVVEVPEVQEEQPVEEITVVQDTPVEETTETIEEVVEPTVVEDTIPESIEEIPFDINIPTEEIDPVVETPVTEETVVEELPTEDNVIDQQIDEIINNAKVEDIEDQPLDIEAMFDVAPVVETPVAEEIAPVVETPTTSDNNLAIDTIFNVESDSLNNETDTVNENLTNDFNQYINDLENKEAQ